MIRFERSFDSELVKRIVTDPQVYRASLLSDFAPPREQYQPRMGEEVWNIAARRESEAFGLYVFVPHSPVWWEAHMCLLPSGWGRGAEISLGVIAWLAKHTTCRKVTATVPAYNRLMHALARRIGMEEVGVLTRSVLKDGQLGDQTIFGIEVKE